MCVCSPCTSANKLSGKNNPYLKFHHALIFLNLGIPFTAYKLGKEYVKGNNSNSTLKEHTSMDQNNHKTEGRLDALHNIDDKILNIGIIIGGVLFSTGVLICFCILCGFMKRNNQLRNLNSVDEESQIQRTFLRYSV